MKAKRKAKAKKKSAKQAKPSKVQRTLVRLEKVIAALALRIDAHDDLAASAHDKLKRIEEFLGPELVTFHEKQPAASLTNGPQAGALVDPE
jgi:hypothetical protein